jgi:hypothetical protein
LLLAFAAAAATTRTAGAELPSPLASFTLPLRARPAAAAAALLVHPAEPSARHLRRLLRAAQADQAAPATSSNATTPSSSSSHTLRVSGSVIGGYFSTTIALGTPPREFDVIVDTGSTMTYVPCAGCSSSGECGAHTQRQGPFDPSASSTARRVGCKDADCRCGSPTCTCGGGNVCSYRRSYAEKSSSSGEVVSDVLRLPDGGGNGSTTTTIVFGCTARETGEIHRQRADGLLGMGLSDDALHAQLARSGAINRQAFGLCLGFPSGGSLVLGGGVPSEAAAAMQWTPFWGAGPANPSSSRGSHYFAVAAEGLSFGGEDLLATGGGGNGGGDGGDGRRRLLTSRPMPQTNSSSSSSSSASLLNVGYGAVFDSGTTFLYLPTKAFAAFKRAAMQAARRAGLEPRPGPDPDFEDVCWTVPEWAADDGSPASAAANDEDALTERLMRALERGGPSQMPTAHLTFAGGATLLLPPRRYLWRDDGSGGDKKRAHPAARGRAVCLGVFDNGREGTLIGAGASRGAFVAYDVEGGRLGFADMEDCGALASGPPGERLVAVVATGGGGAGVQDEGGRADAASARSAPVPPPPPPLLLAAVAAAAIAAVCGTAWWQWRRRRGEDGASPLSWRPVAADEEEGVQLSSSGGGVSSSSAGVSVGNGNDAAARSIISAALATTPTRSGPL